MNVRTILALAFALLPSLVGPGCESSPAGGGMCLFEPCDEHGYVATDPTDPTAPHSYISNLFLAGDEEAIGFVSAVPSASS